MTTPEKQLALVQQELGQVAYDWREDAWLDTGVPDLNTTMGDPGKGLPYGRIFEIAGLPSHGKSAICLSLAALAQLDGAIVIWIDFENSWDARWAAARGLDVSKVIVIRPFVGTFSVYKKNPVTKKVYLVKEKDPRMSSCEELCSLAEAMVRKVSTKKSRIVLVMDSIAAMQPANKSQSRLEDHGMKERNMDLPAFLSDLFGRWVGMAQVYNVMILAINQLRMKPMAFGDPWYSVGGNALLFYAHIRVRVKRKDKMVQGPKQIGIKGLIENVKNKSGGLEKSAVGYKILFQGPIEFPAAKEITKDA